MIAIIRHCEYAIAGDGKIALDQGGAVDAVMVDGRGGRVFVPKAVFVGMARAWLAAECQEDGAR